jgi:mannose-6-phosphate isomerase-like protein (cupin superfamily)
MNIETIVHQKETLAIIIRNDFSQPGLHFFTSPEYSQQLAYMHHPTGKIIQPHIHKPVQRQVNYTQEVLFIKRGTIRVDFYDPQHKYLESRILQDGDIILLASAGHGFEVLSEVEMYEVKQGPYVESEDKVKFDGISSDRMNLNKDER